MRVNRESKKSCSAILIAVVFVFLAALPSFAERAKNVPVITAAPSNQTIAAGQKATFTVVSSGLRLTYQWFKNGSTVSGATKTSYTTPAETTANNGAIFTVVVSSGQGSASASATLTVNPVVVAPSISAQPTSQSIMAGQTATYFVVASGTAPMTYQWKQNGTVIAGANAASYTTPAMSAGSNGAAFSVVVSNAAGTVISSNAMLTVALPPSQLLSSVSSLNFNSVNVNNTSSLNVTLSNSGGSPITIANVSIAGAGFNPSGVAAGLILNAGQTTVMNVSFDPAAAGAVTGSVTVTSNATDPSLVVALAGTGVQPPPSSVMLSWTASSSSVAGYDVFRSNVSGGSYTQVNSAAVTATAYTDTTVQANETYYYVVTAVNASGTQSADSNQASAIVP